MRALRNWRVVLIPVCLAAGCRGSSSSTGADAATVAVVPAAAAPAITPDAAVSCDLDGWAKDVLELAARANKDESVVTAEGCSLFDGRLLTRGFPDTPEKARAALVADAACVPTLTVPNGQFRLVRVEGKAMVSQARNATGQGGALPESVDWESSLMRAARCPAPERRLKTDKDASMALAYAVAMDALQASLEHSVGKGTGPNAKARESLVKVCKDAKKFGVVKDPKNARHAGEKAVPASPTGAALEPLAATALLMAGSFTVFGEAAAKVKLDDPGLKAVRGMALGVVANPPRTNLEGVCAMWAMASDMEKNLPTRKKK